MKLWELPGLLLAFKPHGSLRSRVNFLIDVIAKHRKAVILILCPRHSQFVWPHLPRFSGIHVLLEQLGAIGFVPRRRLSNSVACDNRFVVTVGSSVDGHPSSISGYCFSQIFEIALPILPRPFFMLFLVQVSDLLGRHRVCNRPVDDPSSQDSFRFALGPFLLFSFSRHYSFQVTQLQIQKDKGQQVVVKDGERERERPF